MQRDILNVPGMLLLTPLLATAIFFWRIDREHVWLDEAYSAAMASHDTSELWNTVQADVHPPLYYFALKAATAAAGTETLGLRALSALFAVGLVLLGFGPVLRIFGRTAAYVYTVLVIFSPGVLCFAQEARMYTMAAFFVLAAALYAVEAVQHGMRADFVRFGVSLVAAMYTHYFALASSAIMSLLLLIYCAAKERRRLKPLLITLGAAAVAFLPWVPSFLVQISRVRAGFWIPDTNRLLLKFSLMAPYAYKYEDIPYPWTSVIAMVLSALLIGFGILAYRRRPEYLPHLFLIAVGGLTLLAGLLISKLVVPVLMPRYLICCVGLFLVCVSVGIAALPKSFLSAGATAILVALFLPADYNIQFETFHGPFHEVEAAIAEDGAQDEIIVHEDCQTLFPLQWGLPDHTHAMIAEPGSALDLTSGIYPEENLRVIRNLDEILKENRPFRLVDFSLSQTVVTDTLTPPAGWKMASSLRFSPPLSFTHITLTRWVPLGK